MINKQAKKVNDRLDVKIYDETCIAGLKIIKYSKQDIKRLHIDDLVNDKGHATQRLINFTKDILK